MYIVYLSFLQSSAKHRQFYLVAGKSREIKGSYVVDVLSNTWLTNLVSSARIEEQEARRFYHKPPAAHARASAWPCSWRYRYIPLRVRVRFFLHSYSMCTCWRLYCVGVAEIREFFAERCPVIYWGPNVYLAKNRRKVESGDLYLVSGNQVCVMPACGATTGTGSSVFFYDVLSANVWRRNVSIVSFIPEIIYSCVLQERTVFSFSWSQPFFLTSVFHV